MRQIAILVEGQSEEAFVGRILTDYLFKFDVVVVPIIVQTSRRSDGTKRRGGGTSWTHFRADLRRLVAQPHWSTITTMLDFYGYPEDAPGADCAMPHHHPDCVHSRARAMATDIGDRRFMPYIMVHEFETLIFAASLVQNSLLGDAALVAQLRRQAAAVDDDVELINDSINTAPSKRLKKLLPSYDKVADGVAILEDVGIDRILPHCPGLQSWLPRLSLDPPFCGVASGTRRVHRQVAGARAVWLHR